MAEPTGNRSGGEGGAMALHRTRDDKVLAGVCGGLARWLGWNSTAVRVLYVVVSILSAGFPGTLVYIALWILMPESD
jgi:phage shock protein PspC (stress-responsive transcriptional regulator)